MNTFRGEEGALWASLLPVPASSRVAREVLFAPGQPIRSRGWRAGLRPRAEWAVTLWEGEGSESLLASSQKLFCPLVRL